MLKKRKIGLLCCAVLAVDARLSAAKATDTQPDVIITHGHFNFNLSSEMPCGRDDPATTMRTCLNAIYQQRLKLIELKSVADSSGTSGSPVTRSAVIAIEQKIADFSTVLHDLAKAWRPPASDQTSAPG